MRHVYYLQSATPFVVEAVFVFYRRFMLSLMRDPTVTNIAIVLTAVEEGATRASLVLRDQFVRRWTGKEDYKPDELELVRREMSERHLPV